MIIQITNHRSRIHPDSIKQLHELQSLFKIRATGYFFSPSFRSGAWDGYVKYISDAGYFGTGLWPKIKAYLDTHGFEYDVQDDRGVNKDYKIVKTLKGLTPREYQIQSVRDVLRNTVGDIWFPRGISSQATNAGKTLFAALLYKSLRGNQSCLLVVNRVHLFKQALVDIPKLIDEEVGHVGAGVPIKFKRFTIISIQTLMSKFARYADTLAQFDCVIIDECHYASSKSYQKLLSRLGDATIRVGMSGTAFKHKDKNKNEKVREFFGEMLTHISNDDLIKGGFSTKPIVKVNTGNTKIHIKGDAKEELDKGIIYSKERNRRVLKRVDRYVKRGITPILVVGKFHNHVELLYDQISKAYPELRVSYIHVGVGDRLKRLKKFKDGKIDILISSLLIKEGANLPKIRCLIYAAAGDSMINLLQVVGRALRKDKSKNVVYIEDFYDRGHYLLRHSKHRVTELVNQKFKVYKLYEKKS